ncbi:MAG: hydrogenase accessory protein HypB [Rhodospirillaceae bacterium]|nr:MAG: hydrogenase accessory protein HypB [Rhodospirillaceae bacterium]
MCVTCGCGGKNSVVEGEQKSAHTHDHHHDHHHSHAPRVSPSRIVQIERDILSKNDHLAFHNRKHLAERGILALNLVSSPGSGKTTLLARTATDLADLMPMTVIEGDQQTTLDAERIRATGVEAIQINTGKGCHLDADMVRRALDTLKLKTGGVLFIENVGNLVCPAAFDLGEAAKVAILSVTEGEDKPLKYPDMFQAAQLMILNKSDLLPYVPFDVEKCIEYARRVNPNIEVLQLSAQTGDGLEAWYDWITTQRTLIKKTAEADGE